MAHVEEEFTFEDLPPIEGCLELTWPGKHPLRSTMWHPSLLRESYGSASDGWMNKLYCGDNLQAMAHLLRDFRGKVDLVYIDPPFCSNSDYGSVIHLKGGPAHSFLFTFAETRFGDIWARDEYLQFMYERLILIRELLSEKGSLFFHCDRCNQHLMRCLLDEVFGASVEEEGAPGLVNEIIWHHSYTPVYSNDRFVPGHDTIFWYSKTGSYYFNVADIAKPDPGGAEAEGERAPGSVWRMDPVSIDLRRTDGYPTQKPEALLERIVLAASAPSCRLGVHRLELRRRGLSAFSRRYAVRIRPSGGKLLDPRRRWLHPHKDCRRPLRGLRGGCAGISKQTRAPVRRLSCMGVCKLQSMHQ